MKVIRRISNTLHTDIGIDITITASNEFVFGLNGRFYTYEQLTDLRDTLNSALEMDKPDLMQYLKLNML